MHDTDSEHDLNMCCHPSLLCKGCESEADLSLAGLYCAGLAVPWLWKWHQEQDGREDRADMKRRQTDRQEDVQ